VRLPLQRITSDDSKTGLMLNILGELQKCPDQLFEHLSKADQNKFRPLGEIEFETETDVNEVLLKRFEDRFPELILNYFDKMECFPNLRFQVIYGRFYFKAYEGSGLTENRTRRLYKNLFAFDKIENINKAKQESNLFQQHLVKSSEIERHKKNLTY